MPEFCGQESNLIDKDRRVRLQPHWVEDFAGIDNGEIVIYCLPEGALGVYPESIYRAMRKEQLANAAAYGDNLAVRRSMRRFGAFSKNDTISKQGRITLDQPFLEFAGLTPGGPATVIGVEIGIEIWNPERFAAETAKIEEHFSERGENEMTADLVRPAQ